MVPVDASIIKPTGCTVNVPPLSPVSVTFTAGALAVLQRAEGVYSIVAEGAFVIVTVVVVSKPGQGAAAAILYFTVYVPGLLAEGVITPLVLSIANPVLLLNVPPVVPVITGATEGFEEHIAG